MMAYAAGRQTRPMTFLRARALRVVPLYAAATLAWWAGHPGVAPAHVALSLAFIPHIGPEDTIWPVVWQGWTPLYEAFFYLAFAVSLLLPRARALPILTGVFAALAAAGIISGCTTSAAQVYLSPLLLEFLAGAWLHRAWTRGWLGRPWVGAAALLTGVAAFMLCRNVNFEAWRLLGWGVPALLIVAGALGLERVVPRLPALLLLGNASYALYLTHRFALPSLLAALHPLPTPVALAGVLAGCAALGIAVHLLVERPLTTLLRGRHGAPPLLRQPVAVQAI